MFTNCGFTPLFLVFVFKSALRSVLSTKIHFKHPPCNGFTLLCLPLVFGLLLSVVSSRHTHYFNVVNAFTYVVLLPSTEGTLIDKGNFG